MKSCKFLIPMVMAIAALDGFAEEDWGDLTSYPRSNMVWLGAYGGAVEVNPRSELVAVRHGELRWLVEDQAVVAEGDTIAYYDAAKVDRSQEQLALVEDGFNVKMLELRWAHEEKIRGLERQHDTLALEILQMKLSRDEERLVGRELATRLDEARRKSTVELERLKQKLDPEVLATQLDLQQRELKQELRRAQDDHKLLMQSQALVAKHDGVVHQRKSGEVRAGTIVGELEDRGVAVAKLRVIDPRIRSQRPEDLRISLSGPRGQRVEGGFSHVLDSVVEGLGPKVYCFKLEQSDEFKLDAEMTGERMLSVYRKLEGEAYIIKKTNMLFTEPEKIQELGWSKYIKGIWPKAKIMYIGPNSIAIAVDS